jgi:hypothetical protein
MGKRGSALADKALPAPTTSCCQLPRACMHSWPDPLLTDGVKLVYGDPLWVEPVDDALHLHRLDVEEGEGRGTAGSTVGQGAGGPGAG